jgi:hypothetical protein
MKKWVSLLLHWRCFPLGLNCEDELMSKCGAVFTVDE